MTDLEWFISLTPNQRKMVLKMLQAMRQIGLGFNQSVKLIREGMKD